MVLPTLRNQVRETMKTKRVAVLFGGKSPEHDVSIVTGLQVLGAIDPELFSAFPVYVSTAGNWYVGEELRDRKFYVPGPNALEGLTRVTLQSTPGGTPALVATDSSFLQRPKRFEVDFAVLAFHGLYGEDGRIQGALEIAGVPYSGMRTMAAAVFMDKATTKRLLSTAGIPVLQTHEIQRPDQGRFIPAARLAALLPAATFPSCLKPRNLGSSIGVARVNDFEELSEALPEIFGLDAGAILEPFVPNLVEYNISVCRFGGSTRTSAIESPKHISELLDFKTKYLSQNGNIGGNKEPGQTSQGMLSLTRDINPQLAGRVTEDIRRWATTAFELIGGAGAPRIDFLSNKETGEIWLNEVNPCPGSFAYFLWEAADPPVLFPALLEHLIREGGSLFDDARLSADPTPEDARLFKRKP